MFLPNVMLQFFNCWICNIFLIVISKHQVESEMHRLIVLPANLFHEQSSRIVSNKINESEN
jgi:hypothetical protein